MGSIAIARSVPSTRRRYCRGLSGEEFQFGAGISLLLLQRTKLVRFVICPVKHEATVCQHDEIVAGIAVFGLITFEKWTKVRWLLLRQLLPWQGVPGKNLGINMGNERLQSGIDLPDGRAFQIEETFGYLVSRIKVGMAEALDGALSGLDITHAQWVILVRIATGHGRTSADLCRCSNYDTGSMTRMLDRLEEKGLVVRERSIEDRRIVEIHLTERGQTLIPRLLQIGQDVMMKMTGGFTDAELVQCRSLLGRMVSNLAADKPRT